MDVTHITVKYGQKLVLDQFSLHIPKTGVLCLFGPSGCGKTTLLRVLCGLQQPESGTLPQGLQTAAVFQEDRLLPWLSVEMNLCLGSGISRDMAGQWLQRVGLWAERGQLPGQLSGGMQRRVAVARALAAQSQLLLLDEPFTGVDEETKKLLYPLILGAAKEKPVILVTHHREEAQALGAELLELEGPPLRRKTSL